MKTLPTIIALLLALDISCSAATLSIPDIPVPSLTATEAIAIAQKQIKSDTKCVLVGVQWCLPSSFQAPVNDGSQYNFAEDDLDRYSWFVTYIYKDERLARLYKKAGSPLRDDKYNSVLVIRVKKDGSAGGVGAIR